MRNNIFIILPIALFVDLILPFILAPFYSGYNHLLQVMSVLGNSKSPVHFIYNSWLVILGLILLFGVPVIYVIFEKQSKMLAILMTLVIVIYAIGGCVLSGLFSVGETKKLITLAAKIHAFGSVIGFMLLTLAPLFCSIYFFKINQTLLTIFCVCCFIVAGLFFVLFIMADKAAFQNTVIAFEGIWQRLTLLFMYLPIVSICLYSFIFI